MSIELKDVTARYKGAEIPAIDDINLKINPGDFIGVLGVAGSGKTTLIRTMNGLFPKYLRGKLTGDVMVDEMRVEDHKLPEIAQHIGVVLPDPALQIVSLTVKDDIGFGPSNLGLPLEEIEARVDQALSRTRLTGFENRTPQTLSGGEQQSLAIAGILAMMPKIIAMDEPLSMLDPVGKDRVLDVIRQLNEEFGITIVLTEAGGDIEYVIPYLQKIILMKEGRIIGVGSPAEILSSQEVFEQTGIRPPQVTQLAWMLGEKNPKKLPFTLEETQKYIQERYKLKPKSPEEIKIEKKGRYGEVAIEVKDLHHIFTGGVHACQGINLEVRHGEMVAIIGQNGSGKTTLANHLIGVLKPTNPEAEVIVDGIDVTKEQTSEVIKHINYVFQNPDDQLFCEKVEDEIAFGPKAIKLPEEEVNARVKETLKLFEIEKYRETEIYWLPKDLKTFVAISSVVSLEPRIFIVDEPTTGLDYAAGQKIMKILKTLNERGHTILYITHNMKLVAEYAHRVIVMSRGCILLDDHPRVVFSKLKKLEEAFINPPQITQLGQKLSKYGFPANVMTVDEMYKFLKEKIF